MKTSLGILLLLLLVLVLALAVGCAACTTKTHNADAGTHVAEAPQDANVVVDSGALGDAGVDDRAAGDAVDAGGADGGTFEDLVRAVDWKDIRPPREECVLTHGTWRKYGNGCVDDCDGPSAACTFAETSGCDCGPDRCTVRKGLLRTCVPNPSWYGQRQR